MKIEKNKTGKKCKIRKVKWLILKRDLKNKILTICKNIKNWFKKNEMIKKNKNNKIIKKYKNNK